MAAAHNLKVETHIHAPGDEVFAYVTDPEHLPEWMPHMIEVQNVSGAPAVGTTWEYYYAFAGTHHRGTSHMTEFERGKKVGVRAEGDLASEWHFQFEPEDGSTHVTVEVDYDMPHALLAKIEVEILRRLHANDGKHALENLKAHLESPQH